MSTQLSGSWSDSVNANSVCDQARHFTRMQLSDDHARLAIFNDRTWKSKLGETSRFAATVVAEANAASLCAMTMKPASMRMASWWSGS